MAKYYDLSGKDIYQFLIERCVLVADPTGYISRTKLLDTMRSYDFSASAYSLVVDYLLESGIAVEGTVNDVRVFKGVMKCVRRDSLKIEKAACAKNGRFFFTSAHAAAPAHTGFLDAMRAWCRYNEAETVILPANAHVKALEGQPTYYAGAIESCSELFATKYTVNDNLVAMDLKILPQQRDPLGGILEWGRDQHSVLVAAPRQRFETMATGHSSLPRCLMSTGACTLPKYQENRIGELATRDHVIGGVVVETDGKIFHARHVQAYEDGSFIDISEINLHTGGAIQYFPDGTKTVVRPEAAILGDIHSDLADPECMLAWEILVTATRPKAIVLHDLFDGVSINPHDKGKAITSSQKRFLNLTHELDVTAGVLSGILAIAQRIGATVYVVESNHDLFLVRHLESMDWRNDPANMVECAQLFARQLARGDALQNRLDPAGQCVWVSAKEDVILGGFLVSNHGHIGVAGSKGSLQQLSRYSRHALAHSHQARILNGSVQVGCSCVLKQPYNEKGLLNWIQSCLLTFPGGHFQHVVCIDGKFTAADVMDSLRDELAAMYETSGEVAETQHDIPNGINAHQLGITITDNDHDKVSAGTIKQLARRHGMSYSRLVESLLRLGAKKGFAYNHMRVFRRIRLVGEP